jgi:uncharacterized membrane protein
MTSGINGLDARLRHEQLLFARMRGTQDRVADAITAFSGTMQFLYIHALWFAVWITFNEGLFGRSAIWDPFPFGLLTMIVSLEAIFLSTFVMISQNRQAAREKIRADLDFETNLRSEVWSTHIGRALGVDADHVEREVQALLTQLQARMKSDAQSPSQQAPSQQSPSQ